MVALSEDRDCRLSKLMEPTREKEERVRPWNFRGGESNGQAAGVGSWAIPQSEAPHLTTLWGRYYLHSKEKETESQIAKPLVQGDTVGRERVGILSLAGLTKNLFISTMPHKTTTHHVGTGTQPHKCTYT